MVAKIIEASLRHIFLVVVTIMILIGGALWAVKNSSLDALPDLSPVQVIVQVKWPGQSPKIIEDQIVYPLITNLMSLKNIQTVRAMSSFQNALCYVIFKDGVDIYDARARILEKLSELSPTFPKSASVAMGPDATGVGWAYEYALKSDTKSLDELRTLQDYYYKYALLGVDGVSEVASIGGYIKNYQITINQDRLREYHLALEEIISAIKKNNADVGGRLILENGQEQIIQAQGYIQHREDIENITIKIGNNLPLKISDIAIVEEVPQNRRGMADLNGEGEVVGGIVIVRFGENPYKVIKAVKEKLQALQVDGVEVIETYDRSLLIDKAIDTLKSTLIEESVIVMIVVVLFLFHMRSALVIILILPLTVGLTFLLMKFFGMGSNIMSLGGIAIAIGAMVDAAIVMVENAHKHLLRLPLELQNDKKARYEAILAASVQVGKPIFFALILIVVSFLPIFALSGQEGRLFSPLAFTKTFAMVIGAILSITIVPILMLFLIRGKIIPEEKNWLNRLFQMLYLPLLRVAMKLRYLVLLGAILLIIMIVPLYQKQNWEFMPMMDEHSVMYMPVTPYGIGIDMAKELTQKTDEIIASFPEVKTVFGKAGRADSATDPAPLSMIETIITFKDESQWREGMTRKKLKDALEEKLQIPGLINSWTYPIRGRIDMLLTGIRTPLGIKLYGDDLTTLEQTATEIEMALKAYDGTLSVSSDKINSGYYLDIKLDLEQMSRYGVDKKMILDTISYGVGGARISTLYHGVERYGISLRLQESQRADISSMKEIEIKTADGFFPLKTFASLRYKEGPSVIKSEKGLGVNFIYITPKEGVSVKTYKDRATEILEKIKLPEGYYIEWAGQSEYLESAQERLRYIIPLSLVLIYLLIYLALGSLIYATVIFFTLPLALLGGLWYVDFLNFNLSIAVVVGFLSLLGVAAETSIMMVIYLQEELEKLGDKFSKVQLKEAIFHGAVMRLRPKLMTVFAIIGGLLPIMYISGVGSEVMQRIAAPMIGGMVSSTLLTLLVIPVLFYIIENKKKEDFTKSN
jgi:Cu(I)/Ag(I) efflux system membrane protein CusA/SilA